MSEDYLMVTEKEGQKLHVYDMNQQLIHSESINIPPNYIYDLTKTYAEV